MADFVINNLSCPSQLNNTWLKQIKIITIKYIKVILKDTICSHQDIDVLKENYTFFTTIVSNVKINLKIYKRYLTDEDILLKVLYIDYTI